MAERDLYKRTLQFSFEVIKFCQTIKLDHISKTLINQLIKSSTSIGANYAESLDSSSAKDRYSKIGISRKEAKETQYWIDLITLYSNRIELNALKSELIEIMKILGSIHSKIRF